MERQGRQFTLARPRVKNMHKMALCIPISTSWFTFFYILPPGFPVNAPPRNHNHPPAGHSTPVDGGVKRLSPG